MNNITGELESAAWHWAQQSLAGRLLPSHWHRRNPAGWEPYRLDEETLSEMLTFVVRRIDQRIEKVDVAAELRRATNEGSLRGTPEEEIALSLAEHLRAADDLRAERARAEERARLPEAMRALAEEVHVEAEGIYARSLDDAAMARRAAIFESAAAGTDAERVEAAQLMWATWRAESRSDAQAYVEFVQRFGPVLALPHADQRFVNVDLPPRTPVPLPPWPSDPIKELDELRQVRIGLLLLDAIQRADTERIAELASQVRRAKAQGVGLAFIRSMADDDAKRLGTPKGDLGFVLKWFLHMATRWPYQLRPDHESGGMLVPVPVGPAQLIWIVLGHNAGAFRLPFERAGSLGVHFCSECGKPIFSSRPRKRGTRWFCDPPPGQDRSVCGNRFFSRQAKRRKRAQTEEAG